MKQRNDLESFLDQFDSNEACHKLLFQLKWGNGFKCRRCGHQSCVRGRSRFYLRCRSCHYDESTTANTLFHKIKFPLRKAFGIVYQVVTMKKGMSASEISRQYEITKETAWYFRKKIQMAMHSESTLKSGNKTKKDSLIKVMNRLNSEFHQFDKNADFEVRKSSLNRFKKVSYCMNLTRRAYGFEKKELPETASSIWHKERRGNRWIRILDLTSNQLASYWSEFSNFNLRIWILGIHHRVSVEHLSSYFDEFNFRLMNRFKISGTPLKIINRFIHSPKTQYAEIIAN